MLTRRRFLTAFSTFAAVPAFAATELAHAQGLQLPHLRKKTPPPVLPTFVYFGTDTAKGVAKGIYMSRWDVATGKLGVPQLAAETVRPSFLAVSPPVNGQRRLYVANEATDDSATVSSFAIDAATGALKPINKVSSAGPGPCYVAIDATGHMAVVANYAGSSIATYKVEADGSLSEPVVRLDYKDAKFGKRGPNAARQDAPHPHSVHFSPDNRFLLVNDLGSDQISVFTIDPQTAQLGEPKLFTNDRPGSGPRHIAFHPNGRWIYSINELDSTIDRFLWTTTSSRTEPQGLLVNAGTAVKTVAAGFPVAKNTAAEIEISRDGRFVYASNRGEDTLAVFTIDQGTGQLAFLQRLACGGKGPRQFTLTPSGRWLVCGNENSATVTVFRRDGASGKLAGPVQTVPLDSVMFTLFV